MIATHVRNFDTLGQRFFKGKMLLNTKSELLVGKNWGRTIDRMIVQGQGIKRTVSSDILNKGKPTDVKARDSKVKIQRQDVTHSVTMITEGKDYLAIASV